MSLASLSFVSAQDDDAALDLTRNPQDLAVRFLGYDAAFAVPLPTPLYEVGDMATFWVNKQDADEPVQITAELAASAPNTYLWVEEGLEFDSDAMQLIANGTDQLQMFYRFNTPFGDFPFGTPTPLPRRDPATMLPLSDIDGDPHLYILYAHNLDSSTNVIINPVDALPQAFAPGGFSNQHEMIVINTDAFPPAAALHDDAYIAVIPGAIFDFIANDTTPEIDLWLRAALSQFTTSIRNNAGVSEAAARSYLENPFVPLTISPTQVVSGPINAGQQLFLFYLRQRFGLFMLNDLYTHPGDRLAAIDAVLAANNIIDPITGDVITARDVFADFVMANAVNDFIGDGRYQHLFGAIGARGLIVPGTRMVDEFMLTRTGEQINQFGTAYYRFRTTEPRSFAIAFAGLENSLRLPLPQDVAPDNQFYWSGRDRNHDHTMTRAIDLTDVETATLQFDTWYDLADDWNYAYVTVSTDNGATWDILPAELSATSNPNGLAYGAGFTGVSNMIQEQEFPALGIALSNQDGMTIVGIVAGGGVSRTEIQEGDRIVGYDGEPWRDGPDVLGMLSQFEVGDTVELLIERDGERFDVPVTLGSRIVATTPEWMTQEIDLTAYAGQEILLRFEYISLPNQLDDGIVIDNIRIPEIDFADDAEDDAHGWTLNGWQQIDNLVPQQFLVQAATVRTDTRGEGRVRQLIGPSDDAVEGQWLFTLLPNEEFILSISGLNDDTDLPAIFNFAVVEGGGAQT